MQHKLTVLLTTYNIAEYLPRFFDCMTNQTYKDYCLLIIDDGSTDNTLEVCRKYAEDDTRIEIMALEHYGISKARNIGIKLINTPLTAFADGDDYFEDDYLLHLVESIEKYDADISISRVEYIKEQTMLPTSVHEETGEMVITRENINAALPVLLRQRRLNYLYAKMFRTSLLKDLRVEDDVRQGSDTMFVFQYLSRAQSIVLIDEVDYHYIKYQSRSVTSYNGEDAFERLLRINRFIKDYSEKNDMMTDDLLTEIDGRILISGIWVIEKIMETKSPDAKKAEDIDRILNNDEYIESYNRQKDNFHLYSFTPIVPQRGEKYYKERVKQENSLRIRGELSKVLPDFVLNLYRKIRD